MFDKILNWKLLKGSHDFPGPDGGTCINEAAIVAAGFEYKSVRHADDLPPCFSRLISSYAIMLNDHMPDDVRQYLLMPFVTKLAGTFGAPSDEIMRYNFMYVKTFQMILLPHLEGGLPTGKHRKYFNVDSPRGVISALDEFASEPHWLMDYDRISAMTRTLWYAKPNGINYQDGHALAEVACIAARGGEFQHFTKATLILDMAIRMGRNQEVDLLVAGKRLEQAKTAPKEKSKTREPCYV